MANALLFHFFRQGETVMLYCKDCAYFIASNEKCGKSYIGPDYLYGKPPRNGSAQLEREDLRAKACGPEARFFVQIPVAAVRGDGVISLTVPR